MDARTTDYEWWYRALEGHVGPIHDGHPQPGFYRYRDKANVWHAVAIWNDGGKMIATNDGDTVDANAIWTWAAKNPITTAAYDHWAAHDHRFLDDAPAPPARGSVPGDNMGDGGTVFEQLTREALDLGEQLAHFVDPTGKSKVTNQEEADRAAVLAKKAGELAKKADDQREEEKAPHLAKCREVDDRWRNVIALGKTTCTDAKAAIQPFLQRQRAIELERQAAARRASDEAAAQAAKLAASARPADKIAAAELVETAATKAVEAAPRKVSAGRTGAKVSTRTVNVAVIDDYDLALAHFADHPEIRETVQRLAQQAVTAKVTIPGVRAVPQEKVV